MLLTAGQMDVSFLATMEGAKGADSRVGGIGGLGSRVTQRFGGEFDRSGEGAPRAID